MVAAASPVTEMSVGNAWNAAAATVVPAAKAAVLEGGPTRSARRASPRGDSFTRRTLSRGSGQASRSQGCPDRFCTKPCECVRDHGVVVDGSAPHLGAIFSRHRGVRALSEGNRRIEKHLPCHGRDLIPMSGRCGCVLFQNKRTPIAANKEAHAG